MDPETRRAFSAYVAERADRPFGDVESLSGRTLRPFSIAGQQGAANLLTKARRALDRGDLEDARRFTDRAVRLPYDGHEQAAPAAMAAHMELYCLVTDSLEQAEVADLRWLDAALDVLMGADAAAQFDMRDVLAAIDQDYSLSSTESSRIRAALAPIADRAELRDLELNAPELGEQVMSILIACNDYQTALRMRG